MLSEKAQLIADRPAFPLPPWDNGDGGPATPGFYGPWNGMTYHQWLVGQALAGSLALGWPSDGETLEAAYARGGASVAMIADAVCEALAEREP